MADVKGGCIFPDIKRIDNYSGKKEEPEKPFKLRA